VKFLLYLFIIDATLAASSEVKMLLSGEILEKVAVLVFLLSFSKEIITSLLHDNNIQQARIIRVTFFS